MASHGVTFFLDGYDTTSVALSPLLLEVSKTFAFKLQIKKFSLQLARNQNIQNKLRDEIFSAVDENNRISYEKLSDLPYFDKVVYESLRMNPPLTFSNRVCTEEIELETVKGHKAVIEKGTRIIIPILSYHHDPGLMI